MDNFLILPRALAATLSDAGFAALVGMALARLWLGRQSSAELRTRLQSVSLLCVALLLFALCAQALLATASMIGSTDPAAIRLQMWAVLTETHAGRNLIAQSSVVLLLMLLLALRRGHDTIPDRCLSLALLTLLAVGRAASGHPAADGDFTLPEYVQFVHLASIAIWAGGVIVAGLLVLPALLRERLTEVMGSFLRRLSSSVTVALLFVVLSGTYNAWHGLGGSIHPLANTQWGYLLDAKLVLVLAAVVMGYLNRRMLRRNPTLTLKEAASLTTMLLAEAVVMLLILTVSAFLANSPPADMSTMPM
jgi:putative copper resistance protein D